MKNLILFSLFITFLLNNTLKAEEKTQLLFYIGITMVKPMYELSKEFEKTCNCEIKILQGGSQELYESLKFSEKGDLYLPGSITYRINNLKDGLLLDTQFVGYNKLAILVEKGNPKNIQPDLNIFTNIKYKSVLGSSESGSVGDETKKVLTKFGNYEEALLNTLYLATDSRSISTSFFKKEVDISLSWYATAFFEENKNIFTVLELDEKNAKKNILALNLLSFSKNKKLILEFLKLASSEKGKKIFYKYGFLDDNDLKIFDTIKIE